MGLVFVTKSGINGAYCVFFLPFTTLLSLKICFNFFNFSVFPWWNIQLLCRISLKLIKFSLKRYFTFSFTEFGHTRCYTVIFWISLLSVRVLKLKFRLPGFVTSTFIHWAIYFASPCPQKLELLADIHQYLHNQTLFIPNSIICVWTALSRNSKKSACSW